ncbi:MAG: ATP-dependent DNA helicase, partial [Pseudomonadota bacterium]
REELEAFLDASLAQFSRWISALVAQRQQRDRRITELEFPLGEFRKGQRCIAELVYKCIDQGGELLIEAPTGIGKTAAVLYPAVKALATNKHDRIVFITAKTVGRRAVESTLERFLDAGLRLRTLSISAKERICFSPGKACHGDDCRYARGYYDRLPQALWAALELPTLFQSDIELLAKRFDICPYQLSVDLLPWADLVIADIHYVYSLTATIGSMVQQGNHRWTVLLDEAHNLPFRARKLFHAEIAKAELMAARLSAPRSLAPALNRINRVLLELQRSQWASQEYESIELVPVKLSRALSNFVVAAGEAMAVEAGILHRRPELLAFYFSTIQFLRLAEYWDIDFRCELSRDSGRQSLTVAINCLDPARLLSERQRDLHSVTAFSATLSPANWTRHSLGLGNEAVFRRVDSPFEQEQLEVYLATHISTRFRERERSLPQLGELIIDWLSREGGNCIVYFPSYRYLQDCLNQLNRCGLEETRPNFWVQQRDQGKTQLLDLLSQHRDLVAFCILGGIFSEGIDLPGDLLRSVVIVGVGLPQFNRDTQQLQSWYQQHQGAGFEYAYLYPGMQKVDQALGRVIRTVEDTGRALLVDSRYAQRQYRELLPPWWSYLSWDSVESKR